MTANFRRYEMTEPAIDEEIAQRLLDGWDVPDVVRVYNDRITLRTAYRWKSRLVGLEVIRAGGYEATFALRNDAPPARLTPWEPCGQSSGITHYRSGDEAATIEP